jgi:hypothetical protein
MNMLHRMGLAATAAAASLALLPGTANATPSSGVSATVLFQRTVGDQDYR